ncbi:MAG: phosphoglucosamine mutase [Firmicutes bacterium HGW-Firmicutes-11]|jgi:phosphoglucosamine mutase|nr:MAG: phosphoglucosamine mutase [Firmicutes bacterium HGW-Firmicutes-11]
MSRLFGTDGVRGIANSELTPELAFNLGKAGAHVLSKSVDRPVVLIGKDTRISGDMLEDAISAGILAMGGDVVKAGVLPTPAIAYLVRQQNATAGVVISASHNPFEYNGIKFFNSDGFKLDDDLEDEIEDIIVRNIDVNSHITGEKIGRSIKAEENAAATYAEFLKGTTDTKLNGMKIVLDCANGAAFRIAESVFRDLGAEVIVLANTPDGRNINENCGSTHPAALQKKVTEVKADLGLAFDGDADRLIAVDEKGRTVDGDRMLYISAKMLLDEDKLVDRKVTATVMSNLGFHKAIQGIGCTVDVTSVGDRYVLEQMRKTGCVLGGEQSGHIIFLEHSTTGDGILSAIQLTKAMVKSKKALSILAEELTIYPQVLKNAIVKNENKKKYESDPEILEEIRRIESEMAGLGRVLIRPSGTEPLVRVMLEGEDLEHITAVAEGLATLITRRMG